MTHQPPPFSHGPYGGPPQGHPQQPAPGPYSGYGYPYAPGPPMVDDLNAPDAPLRGASIGEAYKRHWVRGFTFTGRASLSEYWWVALIQVLIFYGGGALAAVLDNWTPTLPTAILVVLALYALASIVPGLALGVRRLHDANFSGWFILLSYLPLGTLVVLVFTLLGANPQGVRFDAANKRRY